MWSPNLYVWPDKSVWVLFGKQKFKLRDATYNGQVIPAKSTVQSEIPQLQIAM